VTRHIPWREHMMEFLGEDAAPLIGETRMKREIHGGGLNLIERSDGSWISPQDPGEPTTHECRVSVTPEEGEILAQLATDKMVLEIGTGLGVSTRFLCSTATHVTTIDPDPWVERNVWPNLPDNCTMLNCREMSLGYDLVFIDGDHQPEALRNDLEYAYYSLRKQGTIVAHDAKAAHVWSVLCDHMHRGVWEYRDTAHGLAIQKVTR
jgi:hypothetical protein